MKREVTYYSCLIGVCLALNTQAQINDDFSDGNFSASPVWTGNDTDFIVNTNFQLQLQSSGTGTSYLSLQNPYPISGAEWEIWARLNFAPSSSNYARIYLVSDQPVLTGPLNGYYLQLGETGTSDQVELFRQNGIQSTSVCRGTTSIAAAFSIRIRVRRDASGSWELWLDPAGGNNFVLEATGTDNQVQTNSASGVLCRYTSTNAANFFFDDFRFTVPPDTIPAAIDSLRITGQNHLELYFNEPVDSADASNAAYYSVDQGMGLPVSAGRVPGSPYRVELKWNSGFQNGTQYLLTVSGIRDLQGNQASASQHPFVYVIPGPRDIIIHEVMADINPAPIGLPAYEYVELFNRTALPVRLAGWKLSDPSSTATLPDITILPDSFYVLTSTGGANAFGNIPVAGLASFPSLNDAGDILVLRDEKGNTISFLQYTTDHYNDPIRSGGGWALEMRDAGCPCAGSENWKASQDISGGTPGRRNSVKGITGDNTAPELVRLSVKDSMNITAWFSEPMDSASLSAPGQYVIHPGGIAPDSVIPAGPDFSSVKIVLQQPMPAHQKYFLTIQSGIDCNGNSIALPAELGFGMAEKPSEKDIVLNEIMFDPREGGVEWIEIYNRSEKVISLRDLYLCSRSDTGGLNPIYPISPEGIQILPGEYKVLSSDGRKVHMHYPGASFAAFVNMSSFLSLSNEGKRIVIADINQQVMDEVSYLPDWHLPLLKDAKGISLERIHYNSPSNDPMFWHSAAENAGYATPGRKNSQFTDQEGGDGVYAEPEIFSPDNDGWDDILSIRYEFDSPGRIGRVEIFDEEGRIVRRLANQEILGTSGVFYWDGTTETRNKAPVGIYLVCLDVFDLKGMMKRYKKAVVVGGRL